MKIHYILWAAAFASVITSCDVTDKKPIDSFTDKSYWNKVSDLEYYANDLYDGLQKPEVDKDNESDNCVTTDYKPLLFNEQNIPAKATNDASKWKWETIRKCNFFLQRYQQVEGTEDEINPYVAEVRFFRALDYFDKIKAYGDVPWYDKDLQTSDTEELYKARDPRDMVLGKIIEDLEFAIQWLPEKDVAVKGRLNKDAARTQLARTCLYYGTYKKYHNEAGAPTWQELLQKAVAVTNDVMANGYEIVKGADPLSPYHVDGYPLYYCNQFVQEDLTSNKECILARIYIDGVLTHETGRKAGSSNTGLSKDFVESFLCKDGTPIFAPGSSYRGDETLQDEFTDRDPRMYQIIDNQLRPYRVRNGERVFNKVPDCGASSAVTGYPCMKYNSPDESQWGANKCTYDWFVYRYAEVLLINAEANAELGQCTQAVLDATINKLRDRVEMAHLTTSPVVDPKPIDYGYTVDPLIYEIRRERRIELITEGFRLDDLKRWNGMKVLQNPKTMMGIRITPAVRELYKGNTTFGGADGRPTIQYDGKEYLWQYPSKSLDDPGRVWSADDRRWLSPIPTDQLTLNPKLGQNPGW